MGKIEISPRFDPAADFVLFEGDIKDLLPHLPDDFAKLVVTSPPYNIGKPYEDKLHLDDYLQQRGDNSP